MQMISFVEEFRILSGGIIDIFILDLDLLDTPTLTRLIHGHVGIHILSCPRNMYAYITWPSNEYLCETIDTIKSITK